MNAPPKDPAKHLAWLGGSPLRMAILGDLILDEYWEGTVSRISPEAPVPVHLVQKVKQVPGGAANVAANIRAVGAEAYLLGVLGDDQAGRDLRKLLELQKINIAGIYTDKDRPTVRKTRISAQNHQIVRLDWEKTHPLADKLSEKLIDHLKALKPDGIIISDYAKGSLSTKLLQDVIAEAKYQNIPVVVDPKGRDYLKYRGADLVTPNLKEGIEALGLDEFTDLEPQSIAQRLKEHYGLRGVLLTLGARGMYGIFPSLESGHSLKARAREVYDVSGAGDTVAAIMGLSYACRMGPAEAMELANMAAGRVVEKWGTQPISQAELESLVLEHYQSKPKSLNKCSPIDQLITLYGKNPANRGKGQKIVFTNGCFDLLHAGHVQYLEEAKEHGSHLIVALNTDRSIAAIKGPLRPIQPLEQRMRLIASLGFVDHVLSFDSPTPLGIFQQFIPDVLVKGADYQVENIVGAQEVLQHGGEVKTLALVEGLSTSALIQRIKDRG